MARDHVIEETRRIRDRLAKRYGYDLRKIARALQQDETKGGRKLVSRPAKKLRERRAKAG